MELEKKIGYRFKKKELLQQALTHKSFSHERKRDFDNEKLEFLGDAVLDLVVGELLFLQFPEDSEGGLSKKRASIVNEDVLFQIGNRLNLSEYLLLGKGESLSGGAQKPRLISSAFEALIGAIYLDGGFEVARVFLQREFKQILGFLDQQLVDFERDYKTRLQELVQKTEKKTPTYELVHEVGPPHERVFTAAIKVGDVVWARGVGKSKKMAEQAAAKAALQERYQEESEK